MEYETSAAFYRSHLVITGVRALLWGRRAAPPHSAPLRFLMKSGKSWIGPILVVNPSPLDAFQIVHQSSVPPERLSFEARTRHLNLITEKRRKFPELTECISPSVAACRCAAGIMRELLCRLGSKSRVGLTVLCWAALRRAAVRRYLLPRAPAQRGPVAGRGGPVRLVWAGG